MDGLAPVCSGNTNPDNIGVPISMLPGQVITSVDVTASPKTGLVTGMVFHVGNTTAPGAPVTPLFSVECGKARGEYDKAWTVSPPIPKGEAAPAAPSWVANVGGEPCATNAIAPILPENLEFFPDAQPSLSGKPLLDKLLAKAGADPPVTTLPSALDPATLRWEFTPQACRASLNCVPGTTVYTTSLGCLLAPGEEVYFVNLTTYDALTNITCPGSGVAGGDSSYIILEPGEDPACVPAFNCTNSPPEPAPTPAPTTTTPPPGPPPPTTVPPPPTAPPPPSEGFPGLIIEGM